MVKANLMVIVDSMVSSIVIQQFGDYSEKCVMINFINQLIIKKVNAIQAWTNPNPKLVTRNSKH